MHQPKGIITAMVSPFQANQSINYQVLPQLIDRLIGHGVNGLFILGTNGEFHTLNTQEKIDLATAVVEHTRGRVPVYAGIGGNSTLEVIELAHIMSQVGLSAFSIITPYFLTLSNEELLHHYQVIADKVDPPIILYNIPKNTKNNLTVQVVANLAKHPNIIGIKDSSGDINQMQAYIEATQGLDFAVMSGSDSLILSALKLGATGAVTATSNVLAKNIVGVYQYWLAGRVEEAEVLQLTIEELRRVLKLGTVPAALKQMVSLTGLDVGQARWPVLPLSDQELSEIKKVIAQYEQELIKW